MLVSASNPRQTFTFKLYFLIITGILSANLYYLPATAQDTQSLYNQLREHSVHQLLSLQSHDQNHEWDVLITSHKGEHTLSILNKDDKELLYTYSQSGMDDSFERLALVQVEGFTPLIASVWCRGVHGEQNVTC